MKMNEILNWGHLLFKQNHHLFYKGFYLIRPIEILFELSYYILFHETRLELIQLNKSIH